MKIFLDKSECLVLEHKDFKNFSIHPLWLRERLNNKKFLRKKNLVNSTTLHPNRECHIKIADMLDKKILW